ncbi:EF-hand domain-containing protein [Kaustia mangrovi]|uniref:EF-hand domain-containing protein n=1 Tax=Kaustia mangrovi TaxID=2593653 RepID=A0A7S8C138_9HYPH|nr:EF-hand domain-containing protein [Kaustia mangrovi]QPC41421.1 EF-hand domain-containing protein [Kaustia mangrovi]
MTKRSKILVAGVALLGLAAAGTATAVQAHERWGGGHHGYHHARGGQSCDMGKWGGGRHGHKGMRAHRKGMHGHGGMHMWRFMERYDANGDKSVTIEEIETVRSDALKKFDADGNGQLSLEEYQALWLDRMHRRMVRDFQRYDVDGDAQVTIEEYVEPAKKRAERFDRNDDGALNRDDRPRPRDGFMGKGKRQGPPPANTDSETDGSSG